MNVPNVGRIGCLLTACFFVLAFQGAKAQGFSAQSELEYRLLYASDDSFLTDSLRPVISRRLMPENLSFMERGMWGENGILRSVGIASPLTPQARKSELSLRRTMLVAHQIGGFATFGLMVASCYYGQRVIDGHRFDSETHSTLVKYTMASYSATALLSILSPPPLIRRAEYSTTSLHKTLAWIHASGMILTPIIGYAVWHLRGPRNAPVLVQNDGAARFHQVSAYLTTTTLGVALAVMTF